VSYPVAWVGDLGLTTQSMTVGIVVLLVASVLVGLAKTSVGGLGLLSVAVFAAVLPSRSSTGVLLPLLLVGDVMAVRSYRAHADWKALWRLMPAVGVGIGLGTVFLARVDDIVMRHTLGWVLLGLIVMQLGLQWRRSRTPQPVPAVAAPATLINQAPIAPSTGEVDHAPGPALEQDPRPHRAAYWGYGSLSGFTTMVANSGGPAMSLYLLSAKYSMLGYLGTYSWFFFLVNAFKVPFSVGLHLIDLRSLSLDLLLAPAVVLGGLLGRRLIGHINQGLFDRLVIVTTVLGALNLLR